MLTHPTRERLLALGLTGMAKAFDDQRRQPDIAALPFEDRLAIMIDREVVERQNKSRAARLKFAGLRHAAVVEDIDLATPRGFPAHQPHRRRLDRTQAERADHRPDRSRKELDRLCAWPQGLPR